MELQDIYFRLRKGQSIRSIHEELGCHRTIIRELKQTCEEKGWLAHGSDSPSELELHQARYGPPGELKPHDLDPFRDELKDYLDKGHSYTVIHTLIKDRHPCSESKVRRYLQKRFPKAPTTTHKRSTIAGDVMEVDYGYLGFVWDTDQKRKRKAWVFSGRLRHSRLAWREVVLGEKQQFFFNCHIHAFEYFGGVPKRVVPDNLKAAVIKASHTEPLVNRAYRDLAEHYGFQISPCDPYQPQQKGGVENDIKYIKRNFWPIYREHESRRGHEVPYSDTIQSALENWSEATAHSRKVGGKGFIPRENFDNEEKSVLSSLPEERWTPCLWTTYKVGRDWRIRYQKASYSVPNRLTDQEVQVRVRADEMDIFFGLERVARHTVTEKEGADVINSEHAPPGSLEVLNASRSSLIREAEVLGKNTHTLCQRIFDDRAIDGIKPARKLVALKKKHGIKRLDQACKRALHYETISYASVKNILEKGLEAEPLDSDNKPSENEESFRFARTSESFLTSTSKGECA